MEVTWVLDPAMDKNEVRVSTKEHTYENESLVTLLNKNMIKLTGKKQNKKYPLTLANCIRFYTENKKVLVTYSDTEFVLPNRIYELEKIVPKNFVKISQSELININFVDHFQVTKTGLIAIYLSGNRISYSSRRYLRKVKEALL